MMRIAWFSPVSEDTLLKSSVLTQLVVPLLARQGMEIELFYGDDEAEEFTNPRSLLGQSAYHYLASFERHSINPFDHFFYQLEDHPRCKFVERHLHIIPGIVYFHDITLNALKFSRHMHDTAPTDLNAEMQKLFGSSAVLLGDYFVQGWSIDVFDAIYPRGEDELRAASYPIFASSDSRRSAVIRANELRNKQSYILPPPMEKQVEGRQSLTKPRLTQSDSERHSNQGDRCVIGFSAGLHIRERAELIIRAFFRERRERDTNKNLLYWVTKPTVDLKGYVELVRRIAQETGFSENEHEEILQIIPSNSVEDFFANLRMLDFFVDGEGRATHGPSMALLFTLANGIPCVTGETGFGYDIYPDCVLRIGSGYSEYQTLKEIFAECQKLGRGISALGAKGEAYLRDVHSAALFSEALYQIFQERAAEMKTERLNSQAHYRDCQNSLIQDTISSKDSAMQAILERARNDFFWGV